MIQGHPFVLSNDLVISHSCKIVCLIIIALKFDRRVRSRAVNSDGQFQIEITQLLKLVEFFNEIQINTRT